MYKIIDQATKETKECQTMRQSFTLMEQWVKSRLNEELAIMSSYGDSNAEVQECVTLLENSIRKSIYIKTHTDIILTDHEARYYWEIEKAA